MILKIDGIGRDDHTLIVQVGKGDGRQQIGKALACPRPSFDHQVLSLVEGGADSPQHLHLLGAVLKPREALGKEATTLKHGRQFIYSQGTGSGCRDQFLLLLLSGKKRAEHLLPCIELGGQLLANGPSKSSPGYSPLQVAEYLFQRPVEPAR